MVRVLIGCSILDMLFHSDLSLLDVLFIYIVKMSGKWIFKLSAHIPSPQLVIGIPDSTKGATKRHVVFLGPWVSSLEHLRREFEPSCWLGIPGRVDHNSYPYSFTNCGIVTNVYCFVCYRKKNVDW